VGPNLMKFIADLHIHSHFSRATSQDLTFEHLHKWAQLKGIQVVGTGDLTHPGWLQEIKTKLESAEEGLFQLKDEYAKAMQPEVFKACQSPVRFILSGEISTIYKKNGAVRKIHHVVFAPHIEAVEKIQAALEKVGNIHSDGRPILGLDSRVLLEMLLEIDPHIYLIPAHIWTPWFSLFGSKSGFDKIEDCFEDLTPQIFAVETGLSSDPPMNWRLSALDRYTLVSNSDAHSPQKLAREANVFETELSYPAMFAALKTGDPATFLGTLEFFPEEGKYHYDGHRKCEICWDPQVTLQHKGICPQCGKPVTIGVMNRVAALADRPEGAKPAKTHPFKSLVPLPEVLSEALQIGETSKRVVQTYEVLLTQLGSELAILQDIPIEAIERTGGTLLAEGIRRVRNGQVHIEAGYDGEFGVIKLFDAGERDTFSSQTGFFAAPEIKKTPRQQKPQVLMVAESPVETGRRPVSTDVESSGLMGGLNPQQREAVLCTDSSLIIVAGPGTGKTRTLTHRMAYLIAEKGVAPENLLAITFTNKAAEEMAQRLHTLLGAEVTMRMIIKTFHAVCAIILRENWENIGLPQHFAICSEHDRSMLLKQRYPDLREKEITQYLDAISEAKNQLMTPEDPPLPLSGGVKTPLTLPSRGINDPEFNTIYNNYEAALQQNQAVDFDDLILKTAMLFETSPDILRKYQDRFRWIAVDEYQDLNFAQYRLLKFLKTPETNLCVIGDPDQAIYGFRGADRTYFLKFQEDFPNAKTLHLSQNYRSTQMIVDAARQVIAQSAERLPLEIWSEFVSQTKLEIYHAPTEKAEAEYVVHEIEKMVGGTSYFSLDSGRVASHEEGTRSFGDFAVLYRLGAQSQPLTEAFERSGIPYQTIGQTSLYAYKEIREILAYLWLLYNPESPLHLTLTRKSFKEIEPLLNELRQILDTQPVTQLIERIQKQTEVCTPERLKRLLAKAAPFANQLNDFLEAAMLQKETDEYDPRADRVTLMTLHASKGLEFPVVFMVGCEETLMPYEREGKTSDLEEERRLFYVGMTRAKDKLVLTHTQKRFLFGQTSQNRPSRFLSDIEQALKELKQMERRKAGKEKADKSQLNLFNL
jgi:DNA helicase-2/ATP-dependent DNA helicase PcrA